jgi:hypothetical protein
VYHIVQFVMYEMWFDGVVVVVVVADAIDI